MSPFVKVHVDLWKRSFRRLLINGPPLSGKSTSLYTFPAPRSIIVAPGEMGYSSFFPDAGTQIDHWEFDSGKPLSWKLVLSEFETLCQEKVSSGEFRTLCIDGLHRVYEVIQLSQGWTTETDPRNYSDYHSLFTNLVSRILGSQVEYIACTAYDGTEPIEGVKGQTQIWPDFPGKMAKRVLGMFPVVFYSQRTPGNPKDRFTWRLRPAGKVQGVGMHIPASIAAKFPAEIEIVQQPDGSICGGWQTVEKLIETA